MNSEENFSHLVLVRHGQSEWNAKNLFTGWKDPSLTKKGIKEAKKAGEKIINEIYKPVWQFDSKWTCVFIGNSK